ncbi:hypothetical protein AWB81_01770 [Caballeronia arationis]|nr:hypothetical protein AWB81_01770 [Caballeronia arationis]
MTAPGRVRLRWGKPNRTNAWSSPCGRLDLELTATQIFSVNLVGLQDQEIRRLSEDPDVKDQTAFWAAEVVAAHLREYGAWSEEELKDHQANIQRTLWTVCCELRDSYRCCWV